jgi:uncharacterized protein (DUF2267 family)
MGWSSSNEEDPKRAFNFDLRAWFDNVREEAEARADDPERRLRAIFEVLAEKLDPREEAAARDFVQAALEGADLSDPGRVFQELSGEMGEFLQRTAWEAGYAEPEDLAKQLLILIPSAVMTQLSRSGPRPEDGIGDLVDRLLEEAPRVE